MLGNMNIVIWYLQWYYMYLYNTLSGIYFQQRIIILGLSHQASPKTLPEPKHKIQRYSEWQASTKAFKIIVDTLEVQVDYFLNGISVTAIVLGRVQTQHFQGMVLFNGRLDFQGIYIYIARQLYSRIANSQLPNILVIHHR